MLCAARAIKNLLRLSVQTSCRENFLCAKRACQPRNTRQKRQNSTLWHKKPPPFAKFNTIFGRATSSLAPRPYFILSPVGFYAQITYHGRRLRKPNLTLTAHLAGGATGFLIRPITIFRFCPYRYLSRKPVFSLSQYIRAGQICHARSCGDGETGTIRPSGYTSLRFVACSCHRNNLHKIAPLLLHCFCGGAE